MMDSSFFAGNRNALVERLNGGLVVLSAHNKLQQRSDMAYAFSQEPNFWYLTGIDEPDWVLIVQPNGKHVLIAPERDDVHIMFDGATDVESIKNRSGIETVIDAVEGDRELRRLARTHPVAYTISHPTHAKYYDFSPNPAIQTNNRRLERIFDSVQDCTKELNQLRAIKQPIELVAMRKAIKLTTDLFKQVHESLQSYTYEYEIEATFTHGFRSKSKARHAYEPIVAGGLNACTLHYVRNEARLKKGSLILLDIGASVEGYAADITRTYAYGNVTKRQADVHAAVEKAHHEIISLIREGVTIESYQSGVEAVMKRALGSLGLANDDKGLRRYFPHAVSHGLGIDVHDSLGAPRMFKENMVLTVEPGIYIPEESIGVRIEDDILVTSNGHKNLSGSLSTGL